MQVSSVRRFRLKDQKMIWVAMIGETDAKQVAVFARRDVIWLQRLFAKLDRGERMNYQAFKHRIRKLMDRLSNVADKSECPPVLPDPKQNGTGRVPLQGEGRRSNKSAI